MIIAVLCFVWFLVFLFSLGYWFGYFYDEGKRDDKELKLGGIFFALMFSGLLYAANVALLSGTIVAGIINFVIDVVSTHFWWLGDLGSFFTFTISEYLLYATGNLVVFLFFYASSYVSWSLGYISATRPEGVPPRRTIKQRVRQKLMEMRRHQFLEALRVKKMIMNRLGRKYDLYDVLTEMDIEIRQLKFEVMELKKQLREREEELKAAQAIRGEKIGIRIDNRDRKVKRRWGNVIVEVED